MCEDVPIANPIIGIGTKRCSKCGETKSLDDFYADERHCDGKMYSCKRCFCQVTGNYQRRKRKESPEVFLGWHRKNTELHRDKINDRHRRVYHKNIEQSRAKVREKNNKVRSTPTGRLNCNISNLMRASLKSGKGGKTWSGVVGYNITKLRVHLEKHFLPGMTWENYGDWHIDHKIPIAAFNFETPTDLDFKRCWTLKNLQPLWAAKNASKSDKVDLPFQPTLLLKEK